MPAKKVERVCPQCKLVKTFDRRHVFCSIACYNAARAGPIASSNQPAEFYDYDAALARFRELIGQKERAYVEPKVIGRKDKVTAAFSDLHIPYHDEDFLAWAIQDSKQRGATQCVVVGDLNDLFGFSRFMKYEFCPVARELGETSKVLAVLADSFDTVSVITGNHDDRAKKFFAKMVPAEFFFLVNWDVMKIAADGLANVEFPSHIVDGRELRFIWNSGDLVLGHPETCSKIGLRAVDNFANWLLQWERVLDLGRIRVIGQGHTHQAGGPMIRGDGLAVFELGCFCTLPDYVFDAKLRYRPQTNAYGLFVQRDGITDLNESRLFFGPNS